MRRIEIHRGKGTPHNAFTETVEAPLPLTNKYLVFAWSGVVVTGDVCVGVHIQAEVHPCVVNTRHVGSAVTSSMDGAVARCMGRVWAIVGHVEVTLHGPSAIATCKVVQDVEIAVLAFRDEDVKIKVVVAVIHITEKEHLVVTVDEMTTLGAIEVCDNTVLSTARSVAPSGPPVVTGSKGFLCNLVASGVFLERFED